MKILHFADLHLDESTRDNTRPALRRLVEAAQEERPDLIVNAGDLSMRRGHLAPWVALELREAHVALARVAPVIVVAGNHDLAGGTDVGTVFGALKASASDAIELFEKPGWIRFGTSLRIACIPYPSRHSLLARQPELKAGEIDTALSHDLLRSVTQYGADADLLIYHGSIAGATTDTEQTMTTEIDMVLEEEAVPASVQGILCGHIHRAQAIGRAAYPGSPAPLNFAEARSDHGYLIWEWIGEGWARRFVHLPVEHPLVTLDWRHGRNGVPDLTRARVRVLLSIARHEDAAARRAAVTAELSAAGAEQVRCIVERPDGPTVRGPEVSAEWSLDRLVDLYAEVHPEVGPILGALKDAAHEVNSKLPAEMVVSSHFAGYELVRAWWKDWKSLADGELRLEDLSELTAIEGPNGSGKSNVAEVEAFALYGRTPRGGQALGEMVRQGARSCVCAVEIVAWDARWKVERRVKVNNKGVGAAELALFREERQDTEAGSGLAWVPASHGTARETQDFIERLVGPWDLYLATRFASQGDIDRLLDLSPAALKETLQQALATRVFDAREGIGAGMLKAAETDLSEHQAGLAAWTCEAGSLPDRQFALADAETAARNARDDLSDAVAEAERRSAELREVGERRAKLAEEVQRHERAVAEAVNAEREAATLASRLGQLKAELARIADAEESARSLPVLRAKLEEEQERAEVRRDIEAALHEAERLAKDAQGRLGLETDNHRQEMDRARFSEERLRRSMNQMLKAQEASSRGWQERLDATQRASAGLASLPFGEKCVKAACALISGAVAARDSLPTLEHQATVEAALSEAQVSAAREELAEHLEHVARLEIAWNERRPLLEADAESARAVLAVKRAQLEAVPAIDLSALKARIAAHEARLTDAQRAAGIRTAIAEVEPLEANARWRAVDVRAQVPTVPSSAELDARWEQARVADDFARKRASFLRSEFDIAIRQAAEAQVRVEAALAARARVDAAAGDGAALAARCDVLRAHQRMVGRDGLPYLVLQRALPALESHANHFLCDDIGAGRRIEIEPLREMRDGSQKAEVVIRYRNDFGLHSLAAASGFERVAIGYALRASLAQVMAEAQGVAVNHWWADEGWGVFDDIQIVTVGQPMLRRLAERFGRVILISHQAPIREVCDTRLRVVADYAGGSRLERVA